jgi:diguanylate cyclase (GGDEF)-like protein
MTDQSATEQLVTLHAASMAILSNLEAKDVLDTVVREMTTMLNAKACTISEWDQEKNLIRTLSGYWPEEWGNTAMDITEYPIADNPSTKKALTDGEVIQLKTPQSVSTPKQLDIFKEANSKTRLLLPLVYQNRVNGLIEVFNTEDCNYSNEEIVVAKLLTNLAAIALENAKLYETAQNEIERRQRIEEKLQHDTLHDPLTSLPNRTLFFNRLEHSIARKRRSKSETFAVLYLDLDKFKVINESLGHLAGDEVLIEVCKLLSDSIREVDTVCRYGGDDFLFLLEEINGLEEVLTVIGRIQDKLNTPIIVRDREVFITASIGIVMNSPEYDHSEEYIRDADIAMYHVKMKGKGRYQVFYPELRSSFHKRLTLESDLKRAIREEEFSLHYQPILALQTNKIIAFEALIRWQTNSFGSVYPSEFIPLAEESGLIIELGYWIIREACKQILFWQEKFSHDPPLRISVNISGKQLNYPGFTKRVEEIITEIGLDPETLIFEVTESVYIGETSRGGKALSNLRDMGIQVHLDDFGTGYSALSYIHDFPVDAIKIARSFVTNFNPRENKRGLVHTIVSMAQNFDLKVVAEGIETPEQAVKLGDIGCQYGQGFRFMKGMKPEDLETYIEKHLN